LYRSSKGANADVYKLAYFGNEFAIPEDRIGEYETPYSGADAEVGLALLTLFCSQNTR
jgi:hypothetical protein